MDIPVKNITDLQSEIIRLERQRQQQEIELKKRFSSPSAAFASLKTLFPKSSHPAERGESVTSTLFSQDVLGLLSRVVLPFTLNKTLFKKSNFIVKTLVGILSQKASTYISEDSVTTVWGRVKSLFTKKPGTAIKPAKVSPDKASTVVVR
ncbi:hypothetical protein HH214_12435 [Mucilaginibacter robiniae]|uniref:Uncharacterized protein n=1 Tax=Mucilaginibacter robiniae TaxID=2728022 RepID=A0A7L5E0S8_9SPHI|nr:hypothetical protein [Mucilaginibacter robiniae]QJD96631.1 hypothetical protein HH214_12435 [Mucilaginibacter robiniae]